MFLYAWLTERFGAAQVFWDREDIDPGQDFRKVLSQQLRDCQAFVALIGPGWSPPPWIQREIRAALRRRALIVPVLVGDVVNLQPESLPASIRSSRRCRPSKRAICGFARGSWRRSTR